MKTRRKPADVLPAAPPVVRAMPGAGHPAPGWLPWIPTSIRSAVGRVRQENQDSIFGMTALLPAPNGTSLPFGFFAVADGMGGLLDGGVASQTAIRLVANYVVRELLLPALDRRPGSGGQLTVAEVLNAALDGANKQIFGPGRAGGMRTGTTFSCAVLLGGQLVTAHVGDSRIYLWGPDGLTLLTHDHSLVARLVAMGQFTAEEARSSPQRNALYRALGQTDVVEVESTTRSWRGAKALLLCTDGLWDLVPDDEIAAILEGAPDVEAAAEELIALANERGGTDNISVILVQLPQAPP